MRIQRGHHSVDGGPQQLMIIYGVDVIAFDALEHFGKQAGISPGQTVRGGGRIGFACPYGSGEAGGQPDDTADDQCHPGRRSGSFHDRSMPQCGDFSQRSGSSGVLP